MGAMDYKIWFHQKWYYPYPDSYPYANKFSYRFKGSLLNSKRNIGICDSGESFSDCYNECNNNCERYKIWYAAGVAYVTLDTIGSIVTFIIGIVLVLDLIKFRYLKKFLNIYTTGFLMVLVAFFHMLAFIVWASVVKLKFDNCSHNYDYSDGENVCGEGGASFAIFILVWLTILSPIYLFFAKRIRIEELNEENTGEAKELLAIISLFG